ncbi:DUF2197 domain-containing protein [Paenibacillus sp. HJGM_3]|uniref:DUF2197 domain-containing protein n=1 Tax=Paenibacillus sp. HJGM_3 TaxID=3379816 RepID=UPI00385DE211
MADFFYYDAVFKCCKQPYRIYAGSESFQALKENKQAPIVCDDCSDRIRFEAIMNFMHGARG